MLRKAIPVLHVSSSEAAETFFCRDLGFHLDFVYRPAEGMTDPCYLGVSREGVVLHASSFSGDGSCPGVVYVLVDCVDDLYREFSDRGVPVDLPPTDQTWGNREMYVKDADRNSIRFVQPLSSE